MSQTLQAFILAAVAVVCTSLITWRTTAAFYECQQYESTRAFLKCGKLHKWKKPSRWIEAQTDNYDFAP